MSENNRKLKWKPQPSETTDYGKYKGFWYTQIKRISGFKENIGFLKHKNEENLAGWIFTTVFVDTRLTKTKRSRKCFQNFRQSYMLSTDRIEIHQSQPASMTWGRSEGHTSGCDWWISIRSVNNTQDWRKFWKRFRGCFVFQSRVSTKTVVREKIEDNNDRRKLISKPYTLVSRKELYTPSNSKLKKTCPNMCFFKEICVKRIVKERNYKLTSCWRSESLQDS